MKTVNKVLEMLMVFGYFHEIWHYLAARAFGLQSTLEKTQVIHARPDQDWKKAVITLAPFVVFTTSLILILIAWPQNVRSPIDQRRWIGWIAIFLGWIGTCWFDLKSFYRFLRYGSWTNDEE